MLVSALIRKAEAEGGFAAILAKGDERAGSVILILTERGADPHIFERVLQANGTYGWQETSPTPIEAVPDLIAKRRRFDPDIWALELDVPSWERFAAEMISPD
ncbi:DUF1491 family protein [Sphingosinicella rhizophila]|uniref:DUF1491 family protein n=1 Tax=Sphingosinicella rhizophila TaxID=3050082 RepID=UPI0028EC874B|nr:DUF1491 family protein [Sphingosinicella sp. GR2756]